MSRFGDFSGHNRQIALPLAHAYRVTWRLAARDSTLVLIINTCMYQYSIACQSNTNIILQVIRGNSIVLIEALERII